MNLFLDTSVILAACGSPTGASREIFTRAPHNGWNLLTTPYVIDEVLHNLPDFASIAQGTWDQLQPRLQLRDTVLTLDRIAVFAPAKDRPILFSALAYADILLTLDAGDFGPLLNHRFYHLQIFRPGIFLLNRRAEGSLL